MERDLDELAVFLRDGSILKLVSQGLNAEVIDNKPVGFMLNMKTSSMLLTISLFTL